MSTVKWSPLRELEEMRRDMDRLFEEFLSLSPRRRRGLAGRAESGMIVPNIEMYDARNEIVVKAELPGINKEDIDLTITKDSLILKGEFKREEERKEEEYFINERNYGPFSRTISLPVEVDSEKARATFKNGILELVIPKREEAKPKEIKIQVA